MTGRTWVTRRPPGGEQPWSKPGPRVAGLRPRRRPRQRPQAGSGRWSTNWWAPVGGRGRERLRQVAGRATEGKASGSWVRPARVLTSRPTYPTAGTTTITPATRNLRNRRPDPSTKTGLCSGGAGLLPVMTHEGYARPCGRPQFSDYAQPWPTSGRWSSGWLAGRSHTPRHPPEPWPNPTVGRSPTHGTPHVVWVMGGLWPPR